MIEELPYGNILTTDNFMNATWSTWPSSINEVRESLGFFNRAVHETTEKFITFTQRLEPTPIFDSMSVYMSQPTPIFDQLTAEWA
jgi:hypothetical protein